MVRDISFGDVAVSVIGFLVISALGVWRLKWLGFKRVGIGIALLFMGIIWAVIFFYH